VEALAFTPFKSASLGRPGEFSGTCGRGCRQSRLRASLYQAPGFSLGALDTPPPPGGANFISGSGDLTEVRSPGQVLSIVFGGPNVSPGAFFPPGVNGTINASSTTWQLISVPGFERVGAFALTPFLLVQNRFHSAIDYCTAQEKT
jgi:hypothetical protein